MKITMIAALSIATAPTALPLAATARADTEYDFLSPSGNINCSMSLQSDFVDNGVKQTGSNVVQCELSDFTWQLPQGCPSKVVGVAFRSDDTAPPVAGCWKYPNQLPLPWPTLNYGQTRTVGSITCDSEPSGVTCTNSDTGHFFRVSRESYELGLLTMNQDFGAHPVVSYRAVNYDLSKGAPITFDTLFKPGAKPVEVLTPIVRREVEKHLGSEVLPPMPFNDPGVDGYQNFAITDDAVIFFFDQGQLLAQVGGPQTISVPRTELGVLLA